MLNTEGDSRYTEVREVREGQSRLSEGQSE